MELLRASMQGSCEFLVENELALIRYKGWLTGDFLLDCFGEKASSQKFLDTRFFLIDFRSGELMFTRRELNGIAAKLSDAIDKSASIAFLVDKPLETAMLYLLIQYLQGYEVFVFTTPESAFSTFASRSAKNVYHSEIYRKLCPQN